MKKSVAADAFLGERERDGIRKLISLREKLSSFRSCRRHKFRNWARSILRATGGRGRTPTWQHHGDVGRTDGRAGCAVLCSRSSIAKI